MLQSSQSSAWQCNFLVTKKQWREETRSENNAENLKQTSQLVLSNTFSCSELSIVECVSKNGLRNLIFPQTLIIGLPKKFLGLDGILLVS